MRVGRLLKRRGQRGAAPLEAVFALAFAALLLLSIAEVAFALYARNVVAASAHEGARAGLELGRSPAHAAALARGTVRRAAGGLAGNVEVHVAVSSADGRSTVRVVVGATVRPPGPLPVTWRTTARASATRTEPEP